MAKPAPIAPKAKVALYDELIATHPNVERKGAANPYTSVNGHMFSYIGKTGRVALRLSADGRDAFMKKYKAKQPVSYGVVMKEYVEVPDSLLKKTAQKRSARKSPAKKRKR